jgi:hypothetical protein
MIEEVYQNFLKDTKDHVLSILHDDGVYRHLKVSKPGTSSYHYHIVTFPGRLVITGDMGSCIFARTYDMFEFFGSGKINPSYWSEKLECGKDDILEFDENRFMKDVYKEIQEFKDENDLTEDDLDILDEIISDAKIITDTGEAYRFVSDTEVSMEFGPTFTFGDMWEHDFTGFTYHYIWKCYAIVHAIKLYEEVKSNG